MQRELPSSSHYAPKSRRNQVSPSCRRPHPGRRLFRRRGLGFRELRVGRSGGCAQGSADLMLRMVAENPTWGAPRIHGELRSNGAIRISTVPTEIRSDRSTLPKPAMCQGPQHRDDDTCRVCTLDQHIGVRIPGGQPKFNNLRVIPANSQPDKGNWLDSFVKPYLYTASLNFVIVESAAWLLFLFYCTNQRTARS